MPQDTLFGDSDHREKPVHDRLTRLRVLITVKAAPVPSERYGETVCIAGLRLDIEDLGWIRLYPVNFRDLEFADRFRKYEVISLDARPNHSDPRPESWRPIVDSVKKEKHLRTWNDRRPHIDPIIEESMCDVLQTVKGKLPVRSLAAIRPREVLDLKIEEHPGWTPAEQRKIDNYVNQLSLGGQPRTALTAPRFRAWYVYRCQSPSCRTHRQGVLDWEFVALQRRLADRSPSEAKGELRAKFLDGICDPRNDVAFYVGNQAKRPRVFSVLGAYYPRR